MAGQSAVGLSDLLDDGLRGHILIELLNIDCMTYMATQPNNAFDLAIVDPPYGIGASGQNGGANCDRWSNPKLTDYHDGGWDKEPPPVEYFNELFRVSRFQIIWGGNYFDLPPSRGIISWDKVRSGNYSEFELAWTSFDRAAKIFKWLWNGFQKQKPEIRIHPTQKPIALYNWLLENYAQKGQKILDTHLGSGSSAIAAHYFGCDFVGCEIDKEYYDAARARFKEQTRQLAMF